MTITIDNAKIKRGSSVNVAAASLERGELAAALDTKELWVGDGTGKVKISDILFYNTLSSFPSTGQINKIYLAKDSVGSYIWDSSTLQYKKYELTGQPTVLYCRARMITKTTFPTSWQDLSYAVTDIETEPDKLYHDATNQDRIYFNEAGYYKVSYKINYQLTTSTGGVATTISSRINKNDASALLATLDEHVYNISYAVGEIDETLTGESIEYFNVGDWVTVQIMNTANTVNAVYSNIQVFKSDSIKGDKGDPGTPGSIWYNGSGIPNVLLGVNNDYYQNTDNGDVYYKQSDSWTLIGNILGSTGPQGPQGPAFQINSYGALDEAKITDIQTNSGASSTDLYYFLVISDTRTDQTTPSALNGDMTVHIVMYDGTNWYDLGPFTGIQGPEGPEGTGLPELNQVASETLQQTTSDQYQQKLSLVLTGLVGGTYRIGWYYEWQYNSIARDFRARVQVDDASTLMEHEQEPKDSGSDQFYPVSGFKYETLTAGDHHVDLDWCSSSLGDTATIRRARLEVWRT